METHLKETAKFRKQKELRKQKPQLSSLPSLCSPEKLTPCFPTAKDNLQPVGMGNHWFSLLGHKQGREHGELIYRRKTENIQHHHKGKFQYKDKIEEIYPLIIIISVCPLFSQKCCRLDENLCKEGINFDVVEEK